MNTETSGARITAERIAEDEHKWEVLPRRFGVLLVWVVEESIYRSMKELAPECPGGLWHFFELSNGGFYMAPDLESPQVHVRRGGYEGDMSPDAAGVASCLLAFDGLAQELRSDTFARHYYQLRNFALEHAESTAILAAAGRD